MSVPTGFTTATGSSVLAQRPHVAVQGPPDGQCALPGMRFGESSPPRHVHVLVHRRLADQCFAAIGDVPCSGLEVPEVAAGPGREETDLVVHSQVSKALT